MMTIPKRSPVTRTGRRLFPGLNVAQKFASATKADILAIETEAARDNPAYLTGLADGVAAGRSRAGAPMRVVEQLRSTVESLPSHIAPKGTHGSDEADAYWSPSVSLRAVLDIIDAGAAEITGQDIAKVAAGLRREKAVRGTADRYGTFNDAYYEQFAIAVLELD